MPKISQLPAGTTPDGTETIAAVQSGATVGLTLNQNVAGLMATQAEAEAGTVNTKNMSPLRTAQQRAALNYTTAPLYPTVAAAQAVTVPTAVTYVRLAGYTTAGDGGGALYKRVSAAPAVNTAFFQDAAAAYFELAEVETNILQFGGKAGDSTFDNTAAFNKFLTYASAGLGAHLYFPGNRGHYYFKTKPSNIETSGVKMTSDGKHIALIADYNRASGEGFLNIRSANGTWLEGFTVRAGAGTSGGYGIFWRCLTNTGCAGCAAYNVEVSNTDSAGIFARPFRIDGTDNQSSAPGLRQLRWHNVSMFGGSDNDPPEIHGVEDFDWIGGGMYLGTGTNAGGLSISGIAAVPSQDFNIVVTSIAQTVALDRADDGYIRSNFVGNVTATANTSDVQVSVSAITGPTSLSWTGNSYLLQSTPLQGSNNLSELTSIPTARVNLKIDQRTAVADAAHVVLSTDYFVEYTSLTVTRTVTLPAATAFSAGRALRIRDGSGSASAAITIDVAPNGTDQINGSNTTQSAIASAYGEAVVISDGVSKWTMVRADVIARRLQNSTLGFDNLINGALAASVASNALTVAIKTLAGADPSNDDPVYVVFRNVTEATGDFSVLRLTAATSVVISSGSTLGTANNIAFRFWIVGFNDAGTFRLGAVNLRSGMNIRDLEDNDIYSSTAEGGAGAADAAQVIYTGSAVTSKAMRILGYVEYSSGLAAAGTYASAPTKAQLFGPGVPNPASIVKSSYSQTGAVATGTSGIPIDDTIPDQGLGEGDEYMTLAHTPKSSANLLEIELQAFVASTAPGPRVPFGLFQDATAAAISAGVVTLATSDGDYIQRILHRMLAGTTSATTFKYRSSDGGGTLTFNGDTSARLMGGTMNSYMRVVEYMG